MGNVHAFAHRVTAVSVASLATAGFVFCSLAGFGCNYLEVRPRPDRVMLTPDGMELDDSVDSALIGVHCDESPFFTDDDRMWNMSQLFFYISLALGGLTTVLAWTLSVCVAPSNFTWRSLSILAACTAVLEVPIFLLFESEPCSMDINRQTCSLAVGGYLNIASIVLFVVMTLWAQCRAPPDWTKETSAWRNTPDRRADRDVKVGEISIPSGGDSRDEGTEDLSAPPHHPHSPQAMAPAAAAGPEYGRGGRGRGRRAGDDSPPPTPAYWSVQRKRYDVPAPVTKTDEEEGKEVESIHGQPSSRQFDRYEELPPRVVEKEQEVPVSAPAKTSAPGPAPARAKFVHRQEDEENLSALAVEQEFVEPQQQHLTQQDDEELSALRAMEVFQKETSVVSSVGRDLSVVFQDAESSPPQKTTRSSSGGGRQNSEDLSTLYAMQKFQKEASGVSSVGRDLSVVFQDAGSSSRKMEQQQQQQQQQHGNDVDDNHVYHHMDPRSGNSAVRSVANSVGYSAYSEQSSAKQSEGGAQPARRPFWAFGKGRWGLGGRGKNNNANKTNNDEDEESGYETNADHTAATPVAASASQLRKVQSVEGQFVWHMEDVEIPPPANEVNRGRSLLEDDEDEDEDEEGTEAPYEQQHAKKGPTVLISSFKGKSQALKNRLRKSARQEEEQVEESPPATMDAAGPKKNRAMKVTIICPDGREEKLKFGATSNRMERDFQTPEPFDQAMDHNAQQQQKKKNTHDTDFLTHSIAGTATVDYAGHPQEEDDDEERVLTHSIARTATLDKYEEEEEDRVLTHSIARTATAEERQGKKQQHEFTDYAPTKVRSSPVYLGSSSNNRRNQHQQRVMPVESLSIPPRTNTMSYDAVSEMTPGPGETELAQQEAMAILEDLARLQD